MLWDQDRILLLESFFRLSEKSADGGYLLVFVCQEKQRAHHLFGFVDLSLVTYVWVVDLFRRGVLADFSFLLVSLVELTWLVSLCGKRTVDLHLWLVFRALNSLWNFGTETTKELVLCGVGCED